MTSMERNRKNDHNILSSIKTYLFIVGSSAVILIALRNSITWHLQEFWGASANFWESVWGNALDKFEATFGPEHLEFGIVIVGTTIVAMSVYWIASAFYIFFDLTGKPEFLRKYKVQPGTNEPVEIKRLLEVIGWVVFNQLVIGNLVTYAALPVMKWRGCSWGRTLPSFNQVLLDLVVAVLCEEVAFYYSHRLVHHRLLYKYIHKRHHEWTSPIAPTALYAHPLEHAVSNHFPPLLGILVMGSHITSAWLWISIATLSTINAHSGYHLPFFPSPESHDFHHLKFNQCYGVLGVLDRFHGTDTLFRNSPAYSRHCMLLSLSSARHIYPDTDKKSQ